MNVLMASTSFPQDAQDWRGRFIYDMAAAVARAGVRLSLWAPPGELPAGVTSALQADSAQWLDRLAARGGIAHTLRNQPLSGLRAAAGLLRRLNAACRHHRTDVYHVNWLQNALALPDDGKPAAITVLGSDFGLLGLPGMATLLRRQLQRRPALLMPNAAWMTPSLTEKFGDLAEIRPNPFGVGKQWFDIEHHAASDGEDWLVVSRITRGKLGDLLEWGEGLFDGRRRLQLFGPMQEAIRLPPWVRYHGPTHPAELCEKWFPKASGLITLSRHDEGRPQVLLEAMAAGLPIIASRLPAHEDLIRPGETGWLAGNQQEFITALDVAAPAQRLATGQRARAWIRREIGTWDDCATRYVRAYRDLLERA